jgi:aryl-alcohol dehydrogenase-like predicted oxidoreductase
VTEAVRAKMLSDRTFNRLEALTAYAGDHGHTLLELAFGWLLGLPSVATVIAGAARAGQAAANARAAGWVLDAEQIAEVQGVLDRVG